MDDKDDNEVEIVGDMDVTMGVSDGPIIAASGSEAMHITLSSRFHFFTQLLILSDGHQQPFQRRSQSQDSPQR